MNFHVNIGVLSIVVAILLGGCGNGKVNELEEKNAALQAKKQEQDSLLNQFMTTFDEFEANLETIKKKENLISMNASASEMRVSQKDKIVEDIQLINGLLDQNRMMIDELNAKAEKFEGQAESYRRMVASLKKQMTQREAQVTELKDQLATLNFQVEELNGKMEQLDEVNESLARLTSDQEEQLTEQEEKIDSQTETIEAQQDVLNTAYYVVGESKNLKDSNVLASRNRINEEMQDTAFTRIDIREVKEIPLGAQKAKLLTPHPEDSYVLTDEDQDKTYDYIQITNPEKFWKTSRYLVVRVN